jgi:hypothetical protein
MRTLDIKETDFTPELNFSAANHTLKFKGVSRPENVLGFYSQALEWLEEYEYMVLDKLESKYAILTIKIEFRLQYFNSASAKAILQMLQKIKTFDKYGPEIQVDFYYDEGDEQMLEDGEELADAVDMEFNFHEV